MPNPYGIPELTVQEVAAKRAANETLILLDVREPHELNLANLGESVEKAPLSEIAQLREDGLPESVIENKDAEIVVFCHHGSRSLQAAAWLKMQGWTNVSNMVGGIHAYAMEVDASVGRY